eukprot:12398452-Karenia_brevis.AAC.1
MQVQLRARDSSKMHPIPSFVSKHPLFKTNLLRLERQCDLASVISPLCRLEVHKACIREAACVTRDQILTSKHDTHAIDMVLTSISRAV